MSPVIFHHCLVNINRSHGRGPLRHDYHKNETLSLMKCIRRCV